MSQRKYTMKLSDFIELNPKISLKKGQFAKKVAMENVIENVKYINNYSIEKYNGGSRFQNGDTLLARITPSLENGKTAYVNFLEDDEIAYGSTEFIVLRAVNKISTSNFIYYFSRTDLFRNLAINSMTGTSGRQRVQEKALIDVEFEIPSLKEQKSIANILSSFDDKIEVNNKINENLEELAQALYKHWFVDFEFPNEDGKPYKSSGGELAYGELGLVPKHWKIEILGNSSITKIIGSGIKQFGNEKIYLATADITDITITNHNTKITMNERPSRANMQPIANSVWFAKMKNSRKLIRISEKSENIINDYIFSTGFAGIKCNNSLNYVWSYISTKEFDEIKNNMATGTTQEAINNGVINKIKFLVPDELVLKQFENITSYIYNQIEHNDFENLKQAEMRDLLLPKLMSGEIRVPIKE